MYAIYAAQSSSIRHSHDRPSPHSTHFTNSSSLLVIGCLAMAEQFPSSSNPASPTPGRRTPPPFTKGGASGAGRKQKSPAELVAHYTAKGMDEKEASEKVIEDLQKALAFSFQSYPMQKMMMMDKQLKTNMDMFTQRLSVIEAKVDSKPALGAVFGAGVAAGGLLKVVWAGVPHVLEAVARISRDARISTSTSRV